MTSCWRLSGCSPAGRRTSVHSTYFVWSGEMAQESQGAPITQDPMITSQPSPRARVLRCPSAERRTFASFDRSRWYVWTHRLYTFNGGLYSSKNFHNFSHTGRLALG